MKDYDNTNIFSQSKETDIFDEPPEECPECGRRFWDYGYLQQHIEKEH